MCGSVLHRHKARKGFVDKVQHFVNGAAKYVKFYVKDVLPHPTKVSKHVEGRAQVLQVSVSAEIKPIIERYGCAIITDIWMEDYHKTSFISGIIHYTKKNSTKFPGFYLQFPSRVVYQKQARISGVCSSRNSVWNRCVGSVRPCCVCY